MPYYTCARSAWLQAVRFIVLYFSGACNGQTPCYNWPFCSLTITCATVTQKSLIIYAQVQTKFSQQTKCRYYIRFPNSCNINILKPRWNWHHFAYDIFNWFFNENVLISIKIPLALIPKGQINNIPVLVEIMAWRRPDDKPLAGPMTVRSLTYMCVTQPQWVKHLVWWNYIQHLSWWDNSALKFLLS